MLDLDSMIDAADLESMLSELGLDVEPRRSKRGLELYFKCINPSHDDDGKKMSMASQGQYKGLFYCWSCKLRGSIVHVVQHALGVGYNQAVKWMHDKTGVGALVGTDSLMYRLKKEKLNYGFKKEEQLLPTYEHPAGDFVPCCHGRQETRQVEAYLTNHRGIGRCTQRKFEVGVSTHRDVGRAITIPIRHGDQVVSIFYAQPCNGGLKRYPKNAPQGSILFNYDECLKAGRYVLVESVLDVLMLDSIGYGPAMACFTNMVSDTQVDLLRRFDSHCVFPDMDSANGWLLVNRLVERLDKSIELIIPPIGKDPGDCSQVEIAQAFDQSIRYCDWEVANYMRIHARSSANLTGSIPRIQKP